MIGFLRPELLLLGLPAGYVLWRCRGGHTATFGLRIAAALALVLALAAPYVRTTAPGRDVVVVVDRSRSMPAGGDDLALEQVRLVERERGPGDRVAVVAFGARAAIERLPSEDGRLDAFQRGIDPDGSSLGEALEAALGLIPEGRPGSVLLISDGEDNGLDPLPAARRAFARGVRVDVRPTPRTGVADLSVERLELPEEVEVGEPFQFSVWVRADRRVESEFVLERGGQRLTSGRRVFEAGANRLVFRDVLGDPGVAEYAVRLVAGDDRVPENNRGIGAVRALGTRPVLVVNHDGAVDTLVDVLRRAGLAVAVTTPEAAPLDRLALTGFRAVVLENVAANRLARGLGGLREFVLERGGGLLVTGGQASFGLGGYFRSSIDELLPVSMEMRQEHRKQGIALVVVMDRSGSMGMRATPTQTKMDLANLGAAAAIDLLAPIDSVGVIAVDSAPHLVQELTRVEEAAGLANQVLRTQAGGDGIFVFSGLRAAGVMLKEATQRNRHVILFSDAADSEEQQKVPELLAQFRQLGISVSVIALGTENDVDAGFLVDVAKRGNGEVYFTQDAAELPRLFAQDTLTASRATFVEEPTESALLPDLFGLGELPADDFPVLPGYNLTYLRGGALAGIVTTDEYRAPVFAFQYQGLGRTAAFTGQIGGTFGAEVVAWEGFAPFFVTAVRWLIGQEEPEELFPSVRREGSHAVVAVEVDPDAPVPPDTAHMAVRITAQDGATAELPLERTGEHRFEARYPLEAEGIALGTVRLADGRSVELPPIALPYSPEFERSADPDRGERLLRRIARESGGAVAPLLPTLFEGERRGRTWRVITRELLLLALLLLLTEIAGRRLQLWGSLRVPPTWRTAAAGLARAAGARAASLRTRLRRRRPAPAGPAGAEPEPEPAEVPAPPAAAPPEPPREETMADALARAQREARRKLGR